MRRGRQLGFCSVTALIVFFVLSVWPVAGQGIQTTLRAWGRVFPAVGPGVAALKRDSSGRYYILAEPATTIFVYDPAGNRVGQIPNANSRGAAIRYAVDIDIDSRGRLFVVDRGANAIKIFAPDGSLIATIPVNAPTSVVALSDGQFAVTSLLSKRLVQIMDEKGSVVRTFGDLADVSGNQPSTQHLAQPQSQPTIADRGRIIGDPAGNIYFAFTSLSDPTLQRFDRFGYSAFQSVVPEEAFGSPQGRGGRHVEVGYSVSGLGWPTSFTTWTDLHSISSISLGNRMRRGLRGQAPSSSSSNSASSSASGSTSSYATPEGDVLDFTADDASGILEADANTVVPDGTVLAEYAPGLTLPGMLGMGIGGMFRGGLPRGFGGAEGFPGPRPGEGPEAGLGAGPNAGPRPDFAGGPPGEGGHEGDFHFHRGFDTYRSTVSVRVNLDNPQSGAREKPVITAVGVDPVTQDVWAGIRDMLVHFDSGGARLDMYYLLLADGASVKPTSILVEPDRLLIAAEPWGVYEFQRPDKPSIVSSPRRSIVPQQITPAPSASTPAPTSPQP